MLFQKYASFSIQHAKLTLFLAVSLIIFFAWLGKDVSIEHSFALLFSTDGETNAYRQEYRETFGSEDGTVFAVIVSSKLSKDLFNASEDITQALEQHESFVRVLSPTNSSVIRGDEEMLFIDPLFTDFDGSEIPLEQKIKLLRESPNTSGRYISQTSNTIVISAEMPIHFSSIKDIEGPADFFKSTITNIISQYDIDADIYFNGIAYNRIAVRNLMLSDLKLLLPIASLLMIILLYSIFKSTTFILITFLTTLFAQLGTRALMGFFDDNINQITITYPILLLVILVANNIHYFHRYKDERSQGKSHEQAIITSVTQLTKAAFISCLTTAIGFFSLMISDMELLSSFGFYLGFGVIFSFIAMVLIIPAGLSLFPVSINTVDNTKDRDISLIDKLVRKTIQSNMRLIMITFGSILLMSSLLIGKDAQYDFFLSDMLDNDHPQVIASEKMEDYISGSIPIEISVKAEDGQFKLSQNLLALDQLSQWIFQQGYGENNQSLASIIKALNKGISGSFSIPSSDDAIAQLLLLAEGSSDNFVEQLVNDDYSHARISIQTDDIGAMELQNFKKKLLSYQENHLNKLGLSVQITGEVPVVYEGMSSLTQELIKSVFIALIFIILTIIILYRDWRLALGAIFPNVLPIAMGLAIFTLTGSALNPLPGIVFCMALGIAVDDTIHSFSRFNEERKLGKSRQQAIQDTIYHIQGALLTSSLIMSLGFLVFLFSDFSWTRDMGWLGALLILLALAADILFTPAVLCLNEDRLSDEAVT